MNTKRSIVPMNRLLSVAAACALGAITAQASDGKWSAWQWTSGEGCDVPYACDSMTACYTQQIRTCEEACPVCVTNCSPVGDTETKDFTPGRCEGYGTGSCSCPQGM